MISTIIYRSTELTWLSSRVLAAAHDEARQSGVLCLELYKVIKTIIITWIDLFG